ncbi:MAG: HDIG domain-containing metalloprotein [Candidatus Woesearchaeota archaeon]
MDPLTIIKKYYNPKSQLYKTLVKHSKAVTKKALEVAENVKHLNPDIQFIKEAAMLHDIGVFLTDDPDIDCHGEAKYICHGILGRKVLEKEELSKHGLVCERHIGVGITTEDIDNQNLPLPKREMIPLTLEEEIICYADLFFSKTGRNLDIEKTPDEVRKTLEKFGKEKIKKFNQWLKKFNH